MRDKRGTREFLDRMKAMIFKNLFDEALVCEYICNDDLDYTSGPRSPSSPQYLFVEFRETWNVPWIICGYLKRQIKRVVVVNLCDT